MEAVSLRRRQLLASAAAFVLGAGGAEAKDFPGGRGMPWQAFAADPPQIVRPGPWTYFTPEEGAAIEAIVDRLIPPDPETPGGKDCGCAVFIDRQLAGTFGNSQGLYMRPPFQAGTPEQGLQSATTPAQLYRRDLGDLDQHCRTAYAGKTFSQLPAQEMDKLLSAMESGTLHLGGTSAVPFFELVLQNTIEGFLADPVYGGNRDMAAWKMIGFPGARYDYRDWVEHHNERYPLPPVGIGGRAEWTRSHT
jgi:gluconate 2-dehydrogenase gamma chain